MGIFWVRTCQPVTSDLDDGQAKRNGGDSRVSQAVGQKVDRPLPALGGEEDGRLRHLASAAGVSGEALGHQVLPGHPKVHRVLDVHLVVSVALWHAAAHCDLEGGVMSAGHTKTPWANHCSPHFTLNCMTQPLSGMMSCVTA